MDKLVKSVKAGLVVDAYTYGSLVAYANDGSKELRSSAASGGSEQGGSNGGAVGVTCGQAELVGACVVGAVVLVVVLPLGEFDVGGNLLDGVYD